MLTCIRYVGQKPLAEDLLQDSFVAIYNNLHSFNPDKGTFVGWGKKLVINVCLQHLRKNNIVNTIKDIFETKEPSIAPSAIENLNLEDLTKIIQKLPKGYRTVFNLYIIDGYNHGEIAQLLNISVSTSKTQLMKAKNMLRGNIENSNKLPFTAYA